jgi:hypothetical protein
VRPSPDEVVHFSEDPGISLFVPHVAATAERPVPYVWAVDADQAPAYWFPRNCPRATAWVVETTTNDDRERIIGPGGGGRVHAVEYPWLKAISITTLYAYRFPKHLFRPLANRHMPGLQLSASRPSGHPSRSRT